MMTRRRNRSVGDRGPVQRAELNAAQSSALHPLNDDNDDDLCLSVSLICTGRSKVGGGLA